MLRSPNQGIDILDALVKRDRLLSFPESKRWLNLQRDSQDEAGATQATYRGDEKLRSLLAGAGHAGTIGQQERQGDDVGGDNAIIDASAVSRGGDDAAERLVGDGADVGHGKTVLGKLGMQGVEGDAGLCDDVAFLDVDLREGVWWDV